MHDLKQPYLLFLGDAKSLIDAKTACGIAHWRPNSCAAQLRLPGCQVDLGFPDLSIEEAAANGIRTLVIGVAPAGGQLAADWKEILVSALECGMDIANGLHDSLQQDSDLQQAAVVGGGRIHELRSIQHKYKAATHRRRSGMRLLTVGTDCCVGKMYTALAIEKEMRSRDINADFRATGQTGILIAGSGIPIDAVVSDFIASSAEMLSPDNDPDHWDIVEGQGSLFHPAYAGVSLGLLHGSQPDALVLCHEAGRERNSDFEDLPLPTLTETAQSSLAAARLTNPEVTIVGASINTSQLGPDEAARLLDAASVELGVPAADPVRNGMSLIVDSICDRFGGSEVSSASI